MSPTAPTLDDTARGGRSGLGLVAVAGLHVRGDGQVDRAGDRGDRSEHLLAGELLSVGVAEGIGRRSARGRDRARPGAGDHDGARRVPRVEEQQRIAGDVEVAESLCLGALVHGVILRSGGAASEASACRPGLRSPT